MVYIVVSMLIIVIEMNMNVKLLGIPEQIMACAIKSGLAKTKTDALRLGLLELENKYNLLERYEDEQDVVDAKKILADMKSGKEKVYSLKEFEKETGLKIS